ncbi:bZIP transcription factor [Fusarium beomiforme]|uniref:BZIP transcription factor n=1 Tax=Fusarium beomiforme TaxID=44412 RepID=A0A9P5A449_9HYPO|nr:bZIP transcription factor [Fusarium beomiforme]
MLTSGGGLVAGPITPPMDDTARDGLDPHLSKAFIQNNRTNVRRRMQNREAQRRFRERREQEQKTLQQVADDLRTEYQALRDQHAKSTTEVSRLLGENDALRSEVKNLRQRWRLVLAILQWPEDSHKPSSPGGDAAFSDHVRHCLGHLADEPSPHSPS